MSLAERAAPGVPSVTRRSAWRLGDLSESRHWAYYLLLPSLLLVAAVAIYPVGSGVWLSFQRYNLLRAPVPSFVGFRPVHRPVRAIRSSGPASSTSSMPGSARSIFSR